MAQNNEALPAALPIDNDNNEVNNEFSR